MPEQLVGRGARVPPGAANVATAYESPRSPWTKSRLLPIALAVGLMAVFLVHRKMAPSSMIDIQKPMPSATAQTNASKIAVCYSGHVGTLAQVYQQNLQALQKISTVPPAFFFVLDLYDDYRDARSGRHFQKSHEIGTLQAMFNQLSTRAVQTISFTEVVEEYERHPCVGEYGPIADDSGHYSQFFAVFHAAARCYSLIQKEEASSGMRFDWILRLRPDMEISVRLPPHDAVPRVHMSGIPMALIPRSLADDYFSIVDAFQGERCKSFDEVNDSPCANYSYVNGSPECFLVKWLHSKGISPSNGHYVNRRIVYPQDDQ